MTKHKKAIALLAVFLWLSACTPQAEPEGVQLWFPTAADRVTSVAQAIATEGLDDLDGDVTVEQLVNALLAGPTEDGLVSPFPAGTELLNWSLEGGFLKLNLSAPYGELTGLDLTLADGCIVLTMCQLEMVERVRVTVEGKSVETRARQILTPEDVIFTGAEEEPRQIDAVLYFPRAIGRGLGFETRELTLTEDDDLYVMLAQALMTAPEDTDLQTLVPEGVSLLGAWVDDGICFVNFSTEFVSLAPEGERERNLLLYSVVDTLGNLNSVSAVQLLIEGERIPEFGGQETNLPLEPDFGLLSGR